MSNKKYVYKQYYAGLKVEEGKQFDEMLKDKGIGFTEFVRQSIEKVKKEKLDSSKEEKFLENQEMTKFINDYETIERALKTIGEEGILENLIRIKKRFIDKLK